MPRTGTGRVYQQRGSKVWWIDYSHRGRRFRESSAKDGAKGTRADATRLLKKRLGEIGRGQFVGPDAERVTFERLVDLLRNDYRIRNRRTWDRAEYSIAKLRDFFGADCPALDITSGRMTDYVTLRLDEGAAPSTVQREIAALSRMFTVAVNLGELSVKPKIPKLDFDNARKGFLRSDDLEAILRKLPDYAKPIVRFAALTGWRKGEILSRTWSHVDFERGVIRLEPGETKNRKPREFPFSALPPLADLLREQREHTRALERKEKRIIPHVFHRNGEPVADIRSAWTRAARDAGLPGALFHDLRRTAVMNLESAGVPRSTAMRLTGHITPSVYDRYAISDSAALAEGVQKLAQLHAARAVSA